MSLGPGPIYSLPPTIGYDAHDLRRSRMPAYSMSGRAKGLMLSKNPGPTLNLESLTKRGPAISHAFSIAKKIPRKDCNIGPGPANYVANKSPYVQDKAPPSYSMGKRNSYRLRNLGPGANAYGPNDKTILTAAPAYSMGGRHESKRHFGSPGAAAYGTPVLKTFLTSSPEYSMSKPSKSLKAAGGPGANNYDCSNYKPGLSSPAFSFGVRHSPKAPPMYVPCDNIKN